MVLCEKHSDTFWNLMYVKTVPLYITWLNILHLANRTWLWRKSATCEHSSELCIDILRLRDGGVIFVFVASWWKACEVTWRVEEQSRGACVTVPMPKWLITLLAKPELRLNLVSSSCIMPGCHGYPSSSYKEIRGVGRGCVGGHFLLLHILWHAVAELSWGVESGECWPACQTLNIREKINKK